MLLSFNSLVFLLLGLILSSALGQSCDLSGLSACDTDICSNDCLDNLCDIINDLDDCTFDLSELEEFLSDLGESLGTFGSVGSIPSIDFDSAQVDQLRSDFFNSCNAQCSSSKYFSVI